MPARQPPYPEAFISTGEAARRCGIARHTLLRAARRGDLMAALRTPGGDLRFRPADVDAFAARMSQAALAVGRAVTGRHLLEEVLRESEDRFRALIERAGDLVAVLAPDATLLYASPSHQSVLGYVPEDMLGRPGTALVHPDDRGRAQEAFDAVVAQGGDRLVTLRVRHADGGYRTLEAILRHRLDDPAVRGIVINSRDVTERERAQEALEAARRLADRRAAAFAALVEVGAAFAVEREPRTLCRLAVAQLASRFGYDLVSIYLREGECLRLQAQHGYDTVLDPLPIQGRGVAARAVRTGATQFVPDAAADPDFLGAVPGLVAEICVPIFVGGQAAGILNVESRTPGLLDGEVRELLQLMALQLAVTLENAALQQGERRRADRLAALQSVTAELAAVRTPAAIAGIVVERGRAALGAAAAVVRLLSGDGAWLELIDVTGFGMEDYRARARLPVSAAHPVCQVARAGRPLWSRVQEEFQAHFSEGDTSWHVASNLQGAAMLPLIVDGRTIRVLGLSFATPQSFDQADRDFLLTLANATAQALERARLDAAERERGRAAEELARLRAAQAAEAEAMATISAALGGTLEPEQLYTLILEQAVRLLPSDHATVLLFEGGWATVAATWGSPALAIGTRVFPVGGPCRPWLPADRSGAVYLADTAAEPSWVDFPPFVGAHRIRSTLAAPLVIDGRTVGLLNLTSTVPGHYGEQQLPLATAFAERVCQALRNARLYQAEQARRRAAEELAQMRSDFLGAVSHELRTPLTAIVGFTELLRERRQTMDEARVEGYLERIIASANRQLRLVQDLLETSRAEAGALRCVRATVHLRPLLERAAAEIQAVYPGQRVDLDGAEAAAVEADPERTLQILVNLVDNAAKYSPEGSPIAVAWGRDGDRLAVRVRDRGSGIPEASRGALFTRFGRLPGSRARAGRTGTGLGLYLSRLLAEAMGGDLALEETGPAGSTFRLRLPVSGDMGAWNSPFSTTARTS